MPHHSPHHQLKSTWTDAPGSWHMFERIAPIHQAPGATGALQGSVEVLDWFIELDDGKIYRKALYLMVKTMVSCRFSLKPIHWLMFFFASSMKWTVNLSEEIHGNFLWKSSVSWGFLTALGVKTLGFILLHKDVQPWKSHDFTSEKDLHSWWIFHIYVHVYSKVWNEN